MNEKCKSGKKANTKFMNEKWESEAAAGGIFLILFLLWIVGDHIRHMKTRLYKRGRSVNPTDISEFRFTLTSCISELWWSLKKFLDILDIYTSRAVDLWYILSKHKNNSDQFGRGLNEHGYENPPKWEIWSFCEISDISGRGRKCTVRQALSYFPKSSFREISEILRIRENFDAKSGSLQNF